MEIAHSQQLGRSHMSGRHRRQPHT
jgi:hypothetical protein